MKRLATVIVLAILLVWLVLLGINDTDIGVADTNVYCIETYVAPHETSNSSASASITITMYTGDE